MTELRTDYKEDILETSQQGKRTFNIVGADGTVLFEGVHIEDVSKYTQVGDEYGQEIINAQNEAINMVSKGSGLVFDTYQDYLDAKARGEVAVGNTIYIKEGNQSEITAEQIVYNNSNVKLALDSLKNTDDKLKSYALLGDIKTPTTTDGIADITLSESMQNFVFITVDYGFGWGWHVYATIPSNNFPIVQLLGCTDVYGTQYPRVGRISPTSNTVLRVTAHSLLGSTNTGADDHIKIFGVIRKS